MQLYIVNKFIAFFLLLIHERASAATTFLRTATYGQFEGITTVAYTDDVATTFDLADVTDILTAPDEVTDYFTTSSQHISPFTSAEAPDVAGLTSTIDAFSVIGYSTADATTPSKYSSLSAPEAAATRELTSSAEIGHGNGRTGTTLQSNTIATAPAASIWSLSLSSDGDSVSTLNASTSVVASSRPATLLSADANAFTISMPTTSSTGTKSIAITTQATTWRDTMKSSFTSPTPATLSGGSQSIADISVPDILSVTTEEVAAISIQTNSPETIKSASLLIPLTSPGVTNNISVYSTPISAATRGFFTSLMLTAPPVTTKSAFFIATPPASLGATGNTATIATPVTASNSSIILGTFSHQTTTPANSKYAPAVSAPPTWSGTVKNIFTLAKPVTSLCTTAKVYHVSTPATSRASVHYFSLSRIICALVMFRKFFITFNEHKYVKI